MYLPVDIFIQYDKRQSCHTECVEGAVSEQRPPVKMYNLSSTGNLSVTGEYQYLKYKLSRIPHYVEIDPQFHTATFPIQMIFKNSWYFKYSNLKFPAYVEVSSRFRVLILHGLSRSAVNFWSAKNTWSCYFTHYWPWLFTPIQTDIHRLIGSTMNWI